MLSSFDILSRTNYNFVLLSDRHDELVNIVCMITKPYLLCKCHRHLKRGISPAINQTNHGSTASLTFHTFDILAHRRSYSRLYHYRPLCVLVRDLLFIWQRCPVRHRYSRYGNQCKLTGSTSKLHIRRNIANSSYLSTISIRTRSNVRYHSYPVIIRSYDSHLTEP